MAKRKKEVVAEFANLICRFGDGVLVDQLDTVVIPALLERGRVRSFGDTRYFFFKTRLVDLGEHDGERFAGVAGRLVKDTRLVREQVFDREQGLVKDSKSIKSSPSSFFLLILNNHRLIFVKETTDAPSLATFRSTFHAFLREKYRAWINDLFLEGGRTGVTKKALMKRVPPPVLDVVPLTSNEAISEFIDRFSVLKSVEIIAKARNHEIDNSGFFAKMQKLQDQVGSSVTTLKHTRAAGLDPDAAVKQINSATAQGNQLVKLAGLDMEGDKLRGNNEMFQLKRPLPQLGVNVTSAAKRLFTNFRSLVAGGAIKIPDTPLKAVRAVKRTLGVDEE